MSKFDESDYHSATMQSTATLLSVGVAIITFAALLKLAPIYYLILLIIIASLIGTSMENHLDLYKINILHKPPRTNITIPEFIKLNKYDRKFRLFNSANILLGILSIIMIYYAKSGGV